FAREHDRGEQLRPEEFQLTATDLEAAAVERALRRAGENEQPWATSFRQSALRTPVQTAAGLLAFQTRETENVPALPSYRRDLFREVRKEYRDALELFECEPPA